MLDIADLLRRFDGMLLGIAKGLAVLWVRATRLSSRPLVYLACAGSVVGYVGYAVVDRSLPAVLGGAFGAAFAIMYCETAGRGRARDIPDPLMGALSLIWVLYMGQTAAVILLGVARDGASPLLLTLSVGQFFYHWTLMFARVPRLDPPPGLGRRVAAGARA